MRRFYVDALKLEPLPWGTRLVESWVHGTLARDGARGMGAPYESPCRMSTARGHHHGDSALPRSPWSRFHLVHKSINTMTYNSGICPPSVALLTANEGGLCQESALFVLTYRTLNERDWRPRRGNIRHRIATSSAPGSCCTPPRGSRTRRLRPAWIRRDRLSASGASASSESVFGAWRSAPAPGAQRSFPPSLVVAIKALACQLPYESQVPLSRWSLPEIRREVIERGLVASIGQTTLWRWLTEDAIRPVAPHLDFPARPGFRAQSRQGAGLGSRGMGRKALEPI